MENIISSKVETLPPTYVIPMHERPLASVPIVKEIPVIDLGEEQTVVAQQLVKALEQYGFFQVHDYFMQILVVIFWHIYRFAREVNITQYIK